MSSEEIEPELWKIFDLQREPDKDFWTEIRRKSELKHRDNSHLPSSFKKVIESGRYEAEPLYSAETIKQLWIDDYKKCILGEADVLRERGEADVAAQLEHLANRFEEVFSSDEQ